MGLTNSQSIRPLPSIDKSLSQNHHRVWSPTHRRAIGRWPVGMICLTHKCKPRGVCMFMVKVSLKKEKTRYFVAGGSRGCKWVVHECICQQWRLRLGLAFTQSHQSYHYSQTTVRTYMKVPVNILASSPTRWLIMFVYSMTYQICNRNQTYICWSHSINKIMRGSRGELGLGHPPGKSQIYKVP